MKPPQPQKCPPAGSLGYNPFLCPFGMFLGAVAFISLDYSRASLWVCLGLDKTRPIVLAGGRSARPSLTHVMKPRGLQGRVGEQQGAQRRVAMEERDGDSRPGCHRGKHRPATRHRRRVHLWPLPPPGWGSTSTEALCTVASGLTPATLSPIIPEPRASQAPAKALLGTMGCGGGQELEFGE